MDNEAIIAKLRSAGIPRDAFTTTLMKEKHPALRQYVEEKEYKEKSILYLYSNNADLPLYLVAKEIALGGNAVQCCRLVDIHTALFKESEEADTISALLDAAEFIAIDGFCDQGGRSEPFFTPYETAYFISWFIRRHQNGATFILRGSDVLSTLSDWWPSSFVGYISKRCKDYSTHSKVSR